MADERLVAEPDDAPLTPNPGGLTNLERLTRDTKMVRLMMAGVSKEVAGPMFGLSPRQAYRVFKTYKPGEVKDFSELDGRVFLDEALEQYTDAISDLALIAKNPKTRAAVRTAAIRTRLEAVRGRIELLQSLGVIPLELGSVTLRDDLIRTVRVILHVLDAFEVDEEVQVAILDAVEGRRPQLPPGKEFIEGEAEEAA